MFSAEVLILLHSHSSSIPSSSLVAWKVAPCKNVSYFCTTSLLQSLEDICLNCICPKVYSLCKEELIKKCSFCSGAKQGTILLEASLLTAGKRLKDLWSSLRERC